MAHFELLKELGRFNNTLVMRFESEDAMDVTFKCPDCGEVAVVTDGIGECRCRAWRAIMTVHGKLKAQRKRPAKGADRRVRVVRKKEQNFRKDKLGKVIAAALKDSPRPADVPEIARSTKSARGDP